MILKLNLNNLIRLGFNYIVSEEIQFIFSAAFQTKYNLNISYFTYFYLDVVCSDLILLNSKQVPSIDPRRILSFFNQFVSQSVRLLNNFAVVCEAKLEDLDLQLQRSEATLLILEAKVNMKLYTGN